MLGWLIDRIWKSNPPMGLMIVQTLICGAFGAVIAPAMFIGWIGSILELLH